MSHITPAAVVADAENLLSFAATDAAADTKAVGCVGYCMTGGSALRLAATRPDVVKAAASIYGVDLVMESESSPHRLLNGIEGEIYVAAAEFDDSVPLEVIDVFESALRRSSCRGSVERYPGTRHGFTFVDRPQYDGLATEQHWIRLRRLFHRNLAAFGRFGMIGNPDVSQRTEDERDARHGLGSEKLKLPTWSDETRALEGVAESLIATWRPGGPTPAEVQDMNKLALSMMACGYLCHVYTDNRRPVFMPLWNYAMNQGGPNPDYIYLTTEIDPSGVYQISGTRGTSRFVEITQQEWDTPGSRGVEGRALTLRSTHDLDELTMADDGSFCVTLSPERPDGYTGDWWPLDPRCRRLLMRKCACDWKHEVDARVAINRMDDPGEDMTPDAIARRLSELAGWINQIQYYAGLVRYYQEHHGINVLLRSRRVEQGEAGGFATRQAYYDGIHQIDDDEALVVEFPVPRQCQYWQILVADDRFATVDWVNRQSSLNDVQARVDPDGWFRGVVSRGDPGVHNWLDKADVPWGILQARFYQSTEYPEATVTKVPFVDVLKHLPPDTPQVTPAERQQQLQERREGAQLRRIW